ncbi:hypothetical protein S40293_11546 [Stachybotrys chartarum IBT 40293]|nr:hypothetical protein S40293_11546 [Stachybotrys chartarum IBT 40293]
MPGTEYNSETGRLEMSPENADKIITKFSAHGRRTVNSGLWISNDINFKKWLEIFQTDLPARRHICLPDDEDFFNKTDDDDEVGEGEEILDVIDVAGETPQSSQLPAIREEVPIPNLRSPARTTAARLLVLPRNPQGQQYAL